jgi:hypothetical protein
MNIVVIIGRVLFGLFGALLLFIGGMAAARGLHLLPGPSPEGALAFGLIVAGIGALLVLANLLAPRVAMFVDALLGMLMGGVWFLQGLNMFPGRSFMNGDLKWTVIGGLLFLFSILLIIAGLRRRAAISAPA